MGTSWVQAGMALHLDRLCTILGFLRSAFSRPVSPHLIVCLITTGLILLAFISFGYTKLGLVFIIISQERKKTQHGYFGEGFKNRFLCFAACSAYRLFAFLI
ncbi:hypothetical protein DL98DRAFT_88223 [Cadophora sp. DSE1049]|nr:hypothetical protein DL98DRAFT_88223 [Cadophora sp. DSE1049]